MITNLWSKALHFGVVFLVSASILQAGEADNGDWTAGFTSPPVSARTHTWWHWMDGNISRAGITADLESMHRVGIQSATVVSPELGIPHGKIMFLSPEWLDMLKFATQEAQRLGMQIGIENCAGWSSSGGPWVTPEYTMQMVVASERQLIGPSHFTDLFPQPETHEEFYRDIRILAFPTPPEEGPAETAPKDGAGAAIKNYRKKADYERGESHEFEGDAATEVSPGRIIQAGKMLDLSRNLDATGKLDWQVPPGKWTVLRFGYTPTGAHNAPAWGDGRGLECDKLSRTAAKFYWDGIMPKVIQTLGPSLVGRTFDHILIDSYEVGSQNWTPAFREEFQTRRGYDLLPFLPALTGRCVESAEKTERFLWDFRRTIADLFTENYYDCFAAMCHQTGIKLEVEPYGNGPFEDLRCARDTDRVMGEFWWPDAAAISSCALAASTAHIYGKTVVGAEAFTSEHGGWDMSPATMKAVGDLAFVRGINAYDFHRFVHQPYKGVPGLTLGPYGSTLERTNNWWEQSVAWETYLARCNFLLQKGLFVADLLYADDEGAPVTSPAPSPDGYGYDCTDQDTLLHRLSARNGRLVLPDGMSYRALVLPPSQRMTPGLLHKLTELAANGVTIIGSKPIGSPSLTGYPQCDAEVKSLAASLWDNGKIVAGKPELDVLRSLGVQPDFQCSLPVPPIYIHRAIGPTDIYFVSNQRTTDEKAECVFRVTGKTPELWHPDTGKIETLALYSDDGTRTRVPLHLDPAGSVFVVFRPTGAPLDHAVSVTRTDAARPIAPSLVIDHAIYGNQKSGAVKDITASLGSKIKDGNLNFLVNNDLVDTDPAMGVKKSLKLDYTLNGKHTSETLEEGTKVDLVAPRAALPEYAVDMGKEGERMEVWEPGTYQVKMSAGETLTKAVTNLPPPLPVGGSWNLTFPPDAGAPPQAKFDQLISWSDSGETGIRYFSGTAAYDKAFEVPAGMVGSGRRLYLDLGDVQVIAQVRLNGQDLGTLWKPPYRVDITALAKVGENALQIKVTNLWPNRLIGDEQLPEDAERKPDGSLKAFPQWLLDGKNSPTGRVTFAAYRHWQKDSPLFPSGLIGPVTLIPSVETAVATSK